MKWAVEVSDKVKEGSVSLAEISDALRENEWTMVHLYLKKLTPHPVRHFASFDYSSFTTVTDSSTFLPKLMTKNIHRLLFLGIDVFDSQLHRSIVVLFRLK